ncbi:hypothetical protein EES43_29005 [Streptomyces sp. ADI96-02]|uniref:hypothetical protein n=1 Tax=Streptomyces sp. ADI96-02 TaxID=1522760 RepID=UPI000FB9F0D7|nr:hypothetical protein [Streptomyces sp. ADI96-02]RPK54394.1 hypothetical protein EES43_29005 [Streptomyces sp. ADI96-02]
MTTHPTHPSLLRAPAPATPEPAPDRPLDLRVQRITVDEITVTEPRQVLAHARQAALTDPDTAALLGHGPLTPLSLPAAAALLCALHDDEELATMGLEPTGHVTRISAARTDQPPDVLEMSDQPDWTS